MKKTSLLHKISFICSVVFIFWGMAQCGATTGGSAAPQSSIPLPDAQDPITISAPDADGIVRVTGSAGAVPNSAIVVVQVGVTLSSVSAEFCEVPVRGVERDGCSTDLPECPSLDTDNRCQNSAGEDGSFTLQVPATIDDNILISYLDPDTCAEVQIYTVVVDEGVLSVGMEVADIIYTRGDDTILFFGASADDDAMAMAYNLTNSEFATNSMDPLVGNIVTADDFVTSAGNDFFVIVTDEKIYMADEIDYDSAGVGGFKEIMNSTELSMTGGQYLGAYVSTMDTEGEIIYGPASANQVFVYFDQAFHVFDFAEEVIDLGLGVFTSAGDIASKTLPINFPIIEGYYSDFTMDSIISIPFFEFEDDKLVMVLGLEHDDATSFVVLRRDYSAYDAYSSSLDFALENTEMIVVGSAAEGVMVTEVEGYSDETQDPYALTILKLSEQDITIMDLSSAVMSCFDDTIIELLDDTAADDDNECYDSGSSDEMTPAASDLDISDVRVLDVLLDTDNYGEMLVVGGNNAGSRFMTQYGTESVYETGDSISAINPIFAGYYSTGNAMVVVDAGNVGDNSSNIILYELASTPSSY